MSNPIQPWRPPHGSNNTKNKCWINAPLYALLSNEYIREKIKNFKTSEGDDADVFDRLNVKRNKVIEELRKFIDDTTVWNQASYEAFLRNTRQLGDVNITEIQIGANGGFDDAKNILDRLISFINDFVLIDVNDNKLKATKHTGIYPKYTDKLISVVSSTACMSLNQTGASHFFSYVKNNTKWFKVDADIPLINGFEPIELEYKDILASFSGNIHNTDYPVCEDNKSRAMYLIELVEPSELSKVESCNYKDGSAINQRDIIKKKGEEQQYFVTYAGKKEDEFGNTICPKITVMQVNTQSDFDLASRIAQDKTVDRQFIEDNNSKLMDINSADFNEYEKQTSGFTKQSVAPASSKISIPPSSSSSSSSSKPASKPVASKPLSIIEIMKELVSEPAPPPPPPPPTAATTPPRATTPPPRATTPTAAATTPTAAATTPTAAATTPTAAATTPRAAATTPRATTPRATTPTAAATIPPPRVATTTGAAITSIILTDEQVIAMINHLNDIFNKVLGTGADGTDESESDGTTDDAATGDAATDESESDTDESQSDATDTGEEVPGKSNEVKVQILDQMVDGHDEVTSEVVNEHTITVPPI